MKTSIQKILSLKNFFSIVNQNSDNIQYCLEKPSMLLVQNIYVQWLQSIWLKADNHFPVLINKPIHKINDKNELPLGVIQSKGPECFENRILEHKFETFFPVDETKLKFKLILTEQDVMQYFIQWQRYRKYWWSTITTSPGLFNVNDIKYEDKKAKVDIIAQLPWGNQIVEKVSIDTNNEGIATLQCCTTLETALITLLSDGMINSTKEEYLRLHRKVAPYKISFALQFNDSKCKNSLQDLAVLLNSKLGTRNISTWFPAFDLPIDEQLTENRRIGVVYTAVISENTLSNGIFHLMNSSTMLKEQIHVADFETYAAQLFQN